jgi:hypothetical protein
VENAVEHVGGDVHDVVIVENSVEHVGGDAHGVGAVCGECCRACRRRCT